MEPDSKTQTLRELLVEMEDLERQLIKMRRRVMLALAKAYCALRSVYGKRFTDEC